MTEEEYDDDEVVKKMMHLIRRVPHGSVYDYEGLESVLIMAAYDQDISMTFVDDGVYMLVKEQDTDAIQIKGFAKTLLALEDYEVEKLYVEKKSLEDRGLTIDDLVVKPEILDAPEIAKLMAEQDVIYPS
jgi:tRNA 2-thiouridine synthesizing protein C